MTATTNGAPTLVAPAVKKNRKWIDFKKYWMLHTMMVKFSGRPVGLDTLAATTAGEGHVCLIYRREDEMPKVKHPLFTPDVQALVVPESEAEEVIAQSEARPIARYRMLLL
jgi:hypothetical protein